jgi:hypothetical protein
VNDPVDLRRTARPARWFAAASLALCAVTAHAAVVEGRTSEGHRYVTGGIGADEVEALRQEAPAFSLQLITAARTGAYLAGTHVRITGPGNNVVLDTTLDAPWLLVDLPGGRYTVRATHSGTTVQRRLTIAPGQPQRIVLHFDAPADGAHPPPAPDASGSRVSR